MKLVGITEKNKIAIFLDEDLIYSYAYLKEADKTIRNYDFMLEWYNNRVKNEWESWYILTLCYKYDCSPKKLPSILATEVVENGIKVMKGIDYYDFPDILNVNGTDYFFLPTDFYGPVNNNPFIDMPISVMSAAFVKEELPKDIKTKMKELDNQDSLKKLLRTLRL